MCRKCFDAGPAYFLKNSVFKQGVVFPFLHDTAGHKNEKSVYSYICQVLVIFSYFDRMLF